MDPAEYLSTAVVVVDPALCPVYMNPAAETLFGASTRPVSAYLPKSLLSRIESSLADGQPWTARELTLVDAGMHPVTVDVALNPASEDRVVLEFSGVDRYLRISREESLQMQHTASQALVRGLAHEIKNPLGGVRGAAQLLERRLDDPALREYTQVIITEADRLSALVDALLGPSRSPEPQDINIHEVTEQVAAVIAAESPTVRIARDYDPSVPTLIADRDQLVQALLNLARNAVQALDGTGTIAVRTRVEHSVTIRGVRHRQVACIDVIDDGPGIPVERQAAVFLPLVTTRAGGSGLGLPIAQSLVTRHRGLIECTSEPGHTVFTVMLPLASTDG